MSAYIAQLKYEGDGAGRLHPRRDPVWCAERFGQSVTFLPDGRMVLVGGEHEDSSDLDFCIYNDVWVFDPSGVIQIYGYPKEVFPPTDFHSATLVGDQLYLVGSLGYWGSRVYGETQVSRLDTKTFRIESLKTSGQLPGWIYGHEARLIGSDQLEVFGGTVVTRGAASDEYSENTDTFTLNVETLEWRRAA
ncbi:MAG: hypothetical protein IT290_08980 [Deltaproteobacteria bacterium]|nr:hypothetical protein [Deltaproteobacteria bacterium]